MSPRKKLLTFMGLALLCVLSAGVCVVWSIASVGFYLAFDMAEAPAAVAPHQLPLLPPGQHLSIIKGFEELQPELDAKAEAYIGEAISRGMKIGRVQTDWGILEPEAGKYVKAELERALQDQKSKGLKPFISLTTMDTGGYSMPPFYMEDGGEKLKGGMTMGSPEITAGFNRLLDWLVPLCKEYDVWAISIANEPETMFEEFPGEIEGLSTFLRSARQHAHSLNPDLAITVTLGAGAVLDNERWIKRLVAESDIATFNYYALNHNTLDVLGDMALVKAHIKQLMAAAGDRYVVIQELGCPAGYEGKPSTMRASLEKQKRFFETMAESIAAHPKLRAAFVFQLVDWSPELAKWFNESLLGEEAAGSTGDKLTEWIMTTGLIRFADGEARPAWPIFLDTITKLQGADREPADDSQH